MELFRPRLGIWFYLKVSWKHISRFFRVSTRHKASSTPGRLWSSSLCWNRNSMQCSEGVMDLLQKTGFGGGGGGKTVKWTHGVCVCCFVDVSVPRQRVGGKNRPLLINNPVLVCHSSVNRWMTLARFCEMCCPHNGIKGSETKFACIGLDINFEF